MYIKEIKQNSGITLVEILISTVILSILTISFMSAFVLTDIGETTSSKVTRATFITQETIEVMGGLNVVDAVNTGDGVRRNVNGIHTTTTVIPHSVITNRVLNVIIQNIGGRELIALAPQVSAIRSTPTIVNPISINIVFSNTGYSLTIPGQTTLTGELETGRALVMINATQYRKIHNITLNITTTGTREVDVFVYDSFENTARIIVPSSARVNIRRITGFTNRNTTLMRVLTTVFESDNSSIPVASSEAILEIRN